MSIFSTFFFLIRMWQATWSRKKLQRFVSQSSFLRQTCRLSELKIMNGNSSTKIQQVNRSGSSSLLHQQSAKCFGGFQRWTLVFRWIILNDLLLKILVTLRTHLIPFGIDWLEHVPRMTTINVTIIQNIWNPNQALQLQIYKIDTTP